MGPAALADLCWCLARLRYQPAEACASAVGGRVDQQLGLLSAQQLGVVVWGTAKVSSHVCYASCTCQTHVIRQYHMKQLKWYRI